MTFTTLCLAGSIEIEEAEVVQNSAVGEHPVVSEESTLRATEGISPGCFHSEIPRPNSITRGKREGPYPGFLGHANRLRYHCICHSLLPNIARGVYITQRQCHPLQFMKSHTEGYLRPTINNLGSRVSCRHEEMLGCSSFLIYTQAV